MVTVSLSSRRDWSDEVIPVIKIDHFSLRNAATGSTFVARRAGM